MKGYLQRMATNAVRPQGGIHPLVGSIYAGPAFAERGTAFDSIAVTEERLLTNSQESARTGKDVREIRPDASRIKVPHSDLPVGERPNDRQHEESGAFRPLLSNAKRETAAIRVHDGVADTKESSRPRALALSYEPLLPREARMPSAAVRVQTPKLDGNSRSAPVEREPDRVEIHIGRIEVTAVPQEAPRPTAARARKSLNLGEYLKRRDGRAG